MGDETLELTDFERARQREVELVGLELVIGFTVLPSPYRSNLGRGQFFWAGCRMVKESTLLARSRLWELSGPGGSR